MKPIHHNRGFIALISVIIISAVLLTTMFALSMSSFFARFDISDTERASEARALAQSCAHIALSRLEQNSGYLPVQGGECVAISGSCGSSDETCKICGIGHTGSSYVIATRAVFEDAYVNLETTATFSGNIFVLESIRALSSYTGPPCAIH